LATRKALYTKVFGNDAGALVLDDLAEKSGFFSDEVITTDPEMLRHREGRRWLFSYIARIMKLDVDDLYEIHAKGRRV
jgi:hypothetical protein